MKSQVGPSDRRVTVSDVAKPVFGCAQWFHFGDTAAVDKAIEISARLGVSRLRTGISWADFHRPEGPDWYDWLLPRLGKHFDLLPCVTYTPPSLGRFPSTAAPPKRPRDYADFLDELVTAYGDWFEFVELWNEPNNLLDWDWRADPDWLIFGEMVSDAAWWMQQRGKGTVLGGMCPTDANWLRLMGERGVLDQIDVVAIHGFPGTWSANFPGWQEEVASVRRVLDGFPGDRQIWITEAGYATAGHHEFEQAAQIIDLMDAPVDRAYWYSLTDLDPSRSTQVGFHVDERHYHTGLVTSDGHHKLSARLLAEGGERRLRKVCRKLNRGHAPTRSPVVITGGCGFLGCHLADALARRGDNVLVVDNLSRAGSEENAAWLLDRHDGRVTIQPCDVRNRHSVQSLLKGARAVLHLAAQVAVTTSVASPLTDFEVNAAGTVNLLEALRSSAPDAPLIFASTNKVYGSLLGENEFMPCETGWWPDSGASPQAARYAEVGVDESAPLDLVSPYGCSKGAADQYVHDFSRVLRVADGRDADELRLWPQAARHRRSGLDRAPPAQRN